MKIAKTLILSIVLSVNIVFLSFAGQWKVDNGWKYQNDDGNYIVNDWYQGSDGNTYYLGKDGVMLTGWFQLGSDWFYAAENGAVIKSKWIDYNGDSYYLQHDGKMASDTIIDGFKIGDDGKKVVSGNSYEIKEPVKVVSANTRSSYGIPAGEYIVYPDPEVAHVKVISGSECIVDKYNFVKLQEGDLTDVNGRYVPIEDVDALDISDSGMFRVGVDIAEGTYNITPPEDDSGHVNIAICTVFNEIPSSGDENKPENNIAFMKYVLKRKGTIPVTVKNGQYLQLINCTADLKRP